MTPAKIDTFKREYYRLCRAYNLSIGSDSELTIDLGTTVWDEIKSIKHSDLLNDVTKGDSNVR